MEELVPKETGHAAKVQAKHTRAADRRAREQSPEVGGGQQQIKSFALTLHENVDFFQSGIIFSST